MALPRARASLLAVAIAPLAALAAVAAAQRGGPILHEDLETPPEEARRAAARLRGSIFGPEPRPGQNPTALSAGSRILPRPERSSEPARREPLHGRGGADRETSFRADRNTRADGVLGYGAVFNPSIAPHKRMSALDAVQSDYTLAIGSPRLRPVAVGGSPDPDRDLFWASLRVELAQGRSVPIPSVAPDMRILSYEIEPDVPVDFFVDGADNFYVRAARGGGGAARLVMLVDADAKYFGAPIPPHLRVRDAEASRIRELPAGPRGQAQEALAQLGLDRDRSLAEALDVLVGYFRSFEAGELPAGTGNIFWDLFTSRLGVCRHRAFAFTIAASALGIPTRYIQNEAHAFAEVHIPEVGWMRVDLGGAALDLEVSGAADTAPHRPRQPGPFDSSGGGERSAAGETASSRPGGGRPGRRGSPGRSTGGDPGGRETTAARAPRRADSSGAADPATGERAGAAAAQPAPRRGSGPAPREPLTAAVTSSDREGFRGDTARIAGRVTGGGSVSGQRVEIYLVPAGPGGDRPVAVGHAVTRAGGRFETTFAIPSDLDLGDYRIVARAGAGL